MSPRAAWRLESLGFREVYDYVAGKQDWFAAGLPAEGKQAGIASIGDLARRDVPTCQLTERVGDVRQRVVAAGWDACVVVNEARIVLGLVRTDGTSTDPQQAVELAMESGPSTFRPNVPLEEMLHYMHEHGVGHALVTTSDGKLVGWLSRECAERGGG